MFFCRHVRNHLTCHCKDVWEHFTDHISVQRSERFSNEFHRVECPSYSIANAWYFQESLPKGFPIITILIAIIYLKSLYKLCRLRCTQYTVIFMFVPSIYVFLSLFLQIFYHTLFSSLFCLLVLGSYAPLLLPLSTYVRVHTSFSSVSCSSDP